MKNLFAAVAATLLSLSCAFAQTTIPSPTINAKSWLLFDASSNQILASNEPDMRIEPASLTKLMTAYVVFDAIQEKRLDMNQMVTVSTKAWKVDAESSKMFIEPRVPVSVHDLVYGLIVQSGNDAAVALAETVAGTEDAFVAMMNREAERIGMKATHFANSHGLPSPDNYSTARDLAILASHLAVDHPELYKIYSTREFTYNNIRQSNRNRLLWLDPTVDGMKTGHTENAGYCLISTAKRPNGKNGDRRLISVVLGTSSDQMRTQESQKLLNWGFLNFDAVRLYAKNQAIDTPNVWKGSQNSLKIGFNHDLYVTVPKGTADKIKTSLTRKDPLVAPIDKNSTVGTLKVTADGKTIVELPVLALEQVGQAGMFGRAFDSLRLLLH
ncbi:MAG TPA: D-alanyl-D-alanine carboxypeptidase family protein [Oxalicibacterium sp.]|uniref:D-alanyl-D-alanine carboxypeptidase family protein n=1 Tax=Oxalicibacterium sp. TaxID=2766525 RepID=UPI002BDB564E|nr:D-alanyl-D-alanine carboxypeptidase family protein [Oxalicibacterium sp.]HWU99355.1 D-alanyl-D-alanine carboxypeptidase family protein [Oxalicibacterium sp.]